MNRKRVRVAAALLAVVSLLAACGGDDDDDDGGAAEEPAGEDATDDTTSNAEEFSLDEPVQLAFLWEDAGESEFAIPDFTNAAEMAIEEINDAGGVGGQPVEFVRIPSSPVDVQAASTALAEALDGEPSMIIGFPGTVLEGLTRQIDQAQVPVLGQLINDNVRLGAPSGSEWIFHGYSSDESAANVAVQYALEDVGAENVGLVHTNESYGNNGAENHKAALEEAGASVYAERSHAPDATDLTEQVLAMQGADAVIAWTFPNPLVVFMNQMLQNNVNIPVVGQISAEIVRGYGLLEGDALNNLYGVVNCNIVGDTDPKAQEWLAKYRERYDSDPNTQSVVTYDNIYLAVEAIKLAQSTEPAAIRDALEEVQYSDGICSDDYHADGAHVMLHQQLVVSFAGGGSETVKEYQTEDEDEISG